MTKIGNKKIGLFIGREWSWPAAFISEVNGRNCEATAEFVQIGDTKWDTKIPYQVIIDRMSQEIPYYRSYLKSAYLSGCHVINDPFTRAADDKFFGLSLASKLGMRTLCTVALPNKRVDTENVPETFRNLTYPLDWSEILDYVGTPADLEDIKTGGNKFRRRITNLQELIEAYDKSDIYTVSLTKSIESEELYRSIVIGQDNVLIVRIDPKTKLWVSVPINNENPAYKIICDWSLSLTNMYGYDVNELEFVIHNGKPLITSPSNSAPEFDINTLSSDNFRWCVEKFADLAIFLATDADRVESHNPRFNRFRLESVNSKSTT